MTPRQARRKRTADWNRAIAEGRVVKFDEGFRSYPTAAEAQAALRRLLDVGLTANLVDPALADLSYEEAR